MKHNIRITFFLVALFLAAQIIGLFLLKNALILQVGEDGKSTFVFDPAKVGEVPVVNGPGFILYLAIGVGIGTAAILLLARFKKRNVWKVWFFFAVLVSIQYALSTIIPGIIAFVVALVLAIWKIYKPNPVVHNLSEVLMYSGIAIILVPLLNSAANANVLGIPGNVFWAAIVLIIISVYDFVAVFKSKHMIDLAKFQTESKVFAGLLIPYSSKKSAAEKPGDALKFDSLSKGMAMGKISGDASKVKKMRSPPLADLSFPAMERKSAILGGGDIAFPLIFSGTVMFDLANKSGIQQAFVSGIIISITTAIALALLFLFAKKDKFYPAMPAVTLGCFVGYGIALLM